MENTVTKKKTLKSAITCADRRHCTMFDARMEQFASGYEPNAPGSVFNPFAPAVREQLALQSWESTRADGEDALFSEMVPLGGLGQMTQTFSLLTPPQSRVGTPRNDPQMNWLAGALHASLRRQSTYRQEMFQQEENRA
eukprot:3239991-Amphidinium_carterae.1